MYFNKKNMLQKKVIKKNDIGNIINKYKNVFFNVKGDLIPTNLYKTKTIKNKRFYENLISNIYFNILEIKYFSNKIIINICIYNREKLYILRRLRLLKTNNLIYIKKRNNINLYNNIILVLKSKLDLINNKLYLYKYYTSKLFLNNSKFNLSNMLILRKILSSILMKKIIFNVTNIKYFHLNNDILLETITRKLNSNRKSSVLTLIRKGLRFAKIAKLHFLLKVKKLDNYFFEEIRGNYSNILKLKDETKSMFSVFSKGVNNHVVGLRLEASGRLTKRLIASRAIKKIKYKGSLNNIYSSVNKNSVINFKGFEKSNISYSNKNTYNLLGSYGIKY
jgi:hypothetical protein